MNVKSPNNANKWQMGFNSAFKGLNANYYDIFTAYLIFYAPFSTGV